MTTHVHTLIKHITKALCWWAVNACRSENPHIHPEPSTLSYFLPAAVEKHSDQLGEERVYLAYTSRSRSIINEVRAG